MEHVLEPELHAELRINVYAYNLYGWLLSQ